MEKTKSILIVTALSGFVRAFLLDDIKILQSMGYEVYCAANGEIDDRTVDKNIEQFRKIGVNFLQIPFSSNKPISKNNLKAFFEIKKILKQKKFDAIHVHTPIPGVIVRIAALRYRKSCKIIYTTHGFFFHEGSSKKSWYVFHTIEKLMSKFCDAIITINMEDYKNAKQMLCDQVFHINGVGIDTKKYDIVVDREQIRKKLGLQETDIALLSIGELSDRKNHQIVIKAMKENGNKKLVYLICGKAVEGEGTYNYLKELAEKMDVRVNFLGYRRDIPEIAKAADIGVIPSTREGLGLAGIEMLASGLPLVASGVHGILDYAIEGKTAYLADPYSALEFSEAISKLEDKSERIKMKEKCILTAKKFDMSVSHEQRSKIYKNVLK